MTRVLLLLKHYVCDCVNVGLFFCNKNNFIKLTAHCDSGRKLYKVVVDNRLIRD